METYPTTHPPAQPSLSPAALPCSAGPAPSPAMPPDAPRRAAPAPAPRCCRTWARSSGQWTQGKCGKMWTNVEENMGEKRWNLEKRLESTSWKLGFEPKRSSFQKPTGGRNETRVFGWNYLFIFICLVERSTMCLGKLASRSNSDLWIPSLAKPPETTETPWVCLNLGYPIPSI